MKAKGNWKTVRLGDVCRVIPGYAFKSKDWCDSGIPVIKIKNIQEDRTIDIGETDHVPESVFSERLRKFVLEDGDILLAMTGATAGKVGRLRSKKPMLLNQRVAKIQPVDADPDFIWAVTSSEKYQSKFFYLADGAAQPNMSGGQIEGVEINLPDLPTQRKIAGILSAYDDLIENNLRRIKILEQMAQSLYREWFVHFRFPGHESARFTYTSLGMVPEGWSSLLCEHVDYKEGPGLRKWQYRSEGIPFLNIRTLGDNDIDLSKAQYLDPAEVDKKYQHFLLEKFDHVVSSSGTIGRVVTVRAAHLPLMLNTSIIRMRPSGRRIGLWQLKHFLLSDDFQNQAIAFATGAAQPNFGPSHLKQMTIIAPSAFVSQEYERLATPLEEAIHGLIATNQNLRRTRDLLLPKLISDQHPRTND